MTSIQKKNSTLWTLYDFANSLAVIVFGIYLSQWLVVENGISDLRFNLIFIISSIALVLTAPFFGIIADKARVKIPSLQLVTFFSFITLFAIGCLTQLAAPTLLVVSLVVFLTTAGQYFYQLSYVFYNPLLKELGNEDEQAKLSGYGAAAGGIGQLVGLLVTLPLATGAIYLFGHRDISQVFLPTAVLFGLLSLPMLLKFKEQATMPTEGNVNFQAEMANLWQKFLDLKKYPGIHVFLLGSFFFGDAVLTASHNFPIYIQQVFQIEEEAKALILASILVAGAIGAVSSGWISQKVGERRLFLFSIAAWAVILPLTAIQEQLSLFAICMTIIGLLLGITTATGRAILTSLTPRKEASHVFGYYALTERLASFIGPLAWGLITYLLAHTGAFRYQVSLATMGIFVLVSLLIFCKLPSDKPALRGA